jgi:oxygen-independent coproporphyrinogen-3 oxidase
MNTLLPTVEDPREPNAAEHDSELATYAYSYPHKSSYRSLSPRVRIADAWVGEPTGMLSLYVHLPFCEMRCGFCNLFTLSQPAEAQVEIYLAALRRQMQVIAAAVPGARFEQLALGGGTPTMLSAAQLRTLFEQLEATFGFSVANVATSIETSPSTATPERLTVLAEYGVRRVSIGVQSFEAEETRLFGRPQRTAEVAQALTALKRHQFPILNIDLIYGHPRQSLATWRRSLLTALDYEPEELYLYPLYIRPETGLDQRAKEAPSHRTDLYEAARELLLTRGYEQSSLRCFHLPRDGQTPVHACQRDGMIGLGCGARSYTRRLHYATRFAVTQAGIQAILGEWQRQSDEDFAWATHGIVLSDEEQLRRYLILSLLQAEGVEQTELQTQFPSFDPTALPELQSLSERDWIHVGSERLQLTTTGLRNSDRVGPLLYSRRVLESLRKFLGQPNASLEMLS